MQSLLISNIMQLKNQGYLTINVFFSENIVFDLNKWIADLFLNKDNEFLHFPIIIGCFLVFQKYQVRNTNFRKFRKWTMLLVTVWSLVYWTFCVKIWSLTISGPVREVEYQKKNKNVYVFLATWHRQTRKTTNFCETT